jgi:Contractile injection system tube protein
MTVQKLYLVAMEGPQKDKHVEAQYNPKEIGVEKGATWSPAKTPTGNAPKLEFTAGSNRTMSLELTFDGYEDGKNVHTEYVEKIVNMAMVMNEGGTKDDDKRPPKVSVVWGDNKLPKFTGVVESVSTKYTMFLPDGTPVRATVNVKLKEAEKVGFKKGT